MSGEKAVMAHAKRSNDLKMSSLQPFWQHAQAV